MHPHHQLAGIVLVTVLLSERLPDSCPVNGPFAVGIAYIDAGDPSAWSHCADCGSVTLSDIDVEAVVRRSPGSDVWTDVRASLRRHAPSVVFCTSGDASGVRGVVDAPIVDLTTHAGVDVECARRSSAVMLRGSRVPADEVPDVGAWIVDGAGGDADVRAVEAFVSGAVTEVLREVVRHLSSDGSGGVLGAVDGDRVVASD